jgi:hypothetical protein
MTIKANNERKIANNASAKFVYCKVHFTVVNEGVSYPVIGIEGEEKPLSGTTGAHATMKRAAVTN